MRKKLRRLKPRKIITYENYDDSYNWKEVLLMLFIWTIMICLLGLMFYFVIKG